ncbi:MAG: class I SAM-dependent methyltransferase [Candidatus Limnocylindria bacterium]
MTPTVGRGRSFDAWADEYDRYRPTYPDALFAHIARELELPQTPHVADLGAGTGRASVAMASIGWRVTSVEPGGPMLEVLRSRATEEGLSIETVQATAEATGLASASFDLATAAQAFHWFDQPAALTEIARIVRPGGGVALFWNVRDEERSPFVADYHRILERYGGVAEGKYLQAGRASGRSSTREALEATEGFGAPELHELRHELPATADGFIGMAFTASYIRALDPEVQDRFRAETIELMARHGHRGDEPFAVPYRIDLWTARRRGA